MTRYAALLIWLLSGFLASPVLAQPADGGRRMEVRLIAGQDSVAPGGQVSIAIEMKPASGWHGYWKNPGDAGAEPRLAWQVPAGWTTAPLQYPVPDRLSILGLVNYVYEGDYALLSSLQAPTDASPGAVIPVRARLEYLVCSDSLCVPETAMLATDVRVMSRPAVARSGDPFSSYRQNLPRPLAQEARFETGGGRIRIAIPLPAQAALEAPYFYPVTLDAIDHSAQQSLSRNGDLLIVETAAGPRAAELQRIEGVLETGPRLGLSLVARPGNVPAAGRPIPAEISRSSMPASDTLLFASLGAILGGLLLNLMPCVFPILSLKALSLVRSGESEAAARREALAYSAGAISTCLALGALLLILRSAGEAAGWAFQLQDPRIVFLLLLLLTAISLSLAGLFALPLFGGGDRLAGRHGLGGAFFTGALAAFVATPCTGPFLGFALGAALILPGWAALAIFAGLGLGLALPFLLLGTIPALRRRLPRPGPWMARFQRILSVPMFLTALGLAWILGRQAGVDAMAIGLAGAMLLGLSLWWLAGVGKSFALVPVLLILAAIVAPLSLISPEKHQEGQVISPLQGEVFDEARLAEHRAAGTPVFLYFTADWCLTCKVNEKAVLQQDEVASAFRETGIRVMVGDWTRGDPAITRFLEQQGRSGVPLYLFYPAGGEPEILPQILTVDRLVSLGR